MSGITADAVGATTSVAVVYESMFGNTRHVAEAIADGIRSHLPVMLLPVRDADQLPPDLDVLLIGGPTHAHGLSRPESRAQARDWAADPAQQLSLDEAWTQTGVRELLKEAGLQAPRFAAFDTRVDMPRLFTGSAAVAIDRRLEKRGGRRIAPPASFVVDHGSRLLPGELDRARAWGAEMAQQMTRTASAATPRGRGEVA